MNKVIQALVVLVSFIFADTIILLSGQEIQNATITEISETEVKYKIGERAIVYSARKDGIAKISYPDGTEDVFAPSTATSFAVTQSSATPSSAAIPVSVAPATGEKNGIKFGIRAGFSLYDYSFGDKEQDRDVDMGYGFGAGLAVSIPIAATLSFVPELSFLYRKPGIVDQKSSRNREEWISEFVISIPVMLQLMPIEGTPFYLAAGIQLELPISSEVTVKEYSESYTVNYEKRTSTDIGVPLGLGYIVTPNIGIDFRAVIGITSPNQDDEKHSLNSYGLGVTYFF